jgi:hypothetical protein
MSSKSNAAAAVCTAGEGGPAYAVRYEVQTAAGR